MVAEALTVLPAVLLQHGLHHLFRRHRQHHLGHAALLHVHLYVQPVVLHSMLVLEVFVEVASPGGGGGYDDTGNTI